MKSLGQTFFRIALAASSAGILLFSFQNCSKGFKSIALLPAGSSTQDFSSTSPAVSGSALYQKNCSGCHMALSASSKIGRSANEIKLAIANIPIMKALSGLSQADLDAIAAALKMADSGSACMVASVGTSKIRRLTTSEIHNSMVDLLGIKENFLQKAFVTPDQGKLGGGYDNDESRLGIGAPELTKLIEAYKMAIASSLSAADSAFLKCTNNVQDANCARTQLQKFAQLAYRRTLNATSAEVESLMRVFTANLSSGYKVALSLALQKALLSPNFLYLSLSSGAASSKGKELTAFEFASRLSFFLWSSVPDQRLLDLAAAGTLNVKNTPVLLGEIQRMLKDPKADRFLYNFFDQWLGFSQVVDEVSIVRDGLTTELRQDMLAETKAFLRGMINEDKSLISLVTADFSYLNSRLAAHYGIAGVTGTAFTKTSLVGSSLRGVVTHASILTNKSHTDESSPIMRGHFLLEGITCQPPPPFPDKMEPIKELPKDPNMTVRERLAAHENQNSTCYGCHVQMDPLGLSLENFNQIGKFQNLYSNGKPVDASGSIFGEGFQSYADLNQILAKQSNVKMCLAKQVLTYALAREAKPDESCLAQLIGNVAVQENSKFSDFILNIVSSETFRFNWTDSN